MISLMTTRLSGAALVVSRVCGVMKYHCGPPSGTRLKESLSMPLRLTESTTRSSAVPAKRERKTLSPVTSRTNPMVGGLLKSLAAWKLTKPCAKGRARRDLPFLQFGVGVSLIAQVPARPQRDGVVGWVVEFDPVRKVGGGKHLVQHHAGRHGRLRLAWRAVQIPAGPPITGIFARAAALRDKRGIEQDERMARAVGLRRPATAIAEIEFDDVRATRGGAQRELLPAVGKPTVKRADDGHASVEPVKCPECREVRRADDQQVS